MYIILHIYIYAYMYSMYTYRYQHGHGVANRNHVRFAVAAFAPVPGAEEAPSSKSAHFRTFYLHILHILYMYVIYIYILYCIYSEGTCPRRLLYHLFEAPVLGPWAHLGFEKKRPQSLNKRPTKA